MEGHWLFWALLSAVFAAATAIFTKVGLQEVDADFANALRTAFILVIVVAFVWLTGKWSSPAGVNAKTWSYLALSALATGASWVCYFRALKMGSASHVAPIDKLSVIMVAVFAVAFLGERLSLREWAGVFLMGAGAVILALGKSP